MKAQEKKAQLELAQGKQVKLTLSEQDEAQEAFSELEGKAEEFAGKQDSFDKASKAATVVDVENALKQREEESHRAQQKVISAKQELLNARKAQEDAAAVLTGEINRESVREEARKQRVYLEELSEKVIQLKQAKQQLAAADKDIVEQNHRLDRLKTRLFQTRMSWRGCAENFWNRVKPRPSLKY